MTTATLERTTNLAATDAPARIGRRAAATVDQRRSTSDSRTMRMDRLRDRISANAYEVDSAAVATAILERLLAGRWLSA